MPIFGKRLKSKHRSTLIKKLPFAYRYLALERHPRLLLEALKEYGTSEIKGYENNQIIIEWAKEVGGWIGSWYNKDSIPWCGLFMAVIAKRAGLPYNQKALSALSWAGWGDPVDTPMLGDILTFTRDGGGHVGLYVAEDGEYYHVLGGNQSDQVNIKRIAKYRLYEARRTKWKWREPLNIRRIWLEAKGDITENEA